jgi:hypothetical protein
LLNVPETTGHAVNNCFPLLTLGGGLSAGAVAMPGAAHSDYEKLTCLTIGGTVIAAGSA